MSAPICPLCRTGRDVVSNGDGSYCCEGCLWDWAPGDEDVRPDDWEGDK